ncbi:MAG: dicarboxylate/amino acid:cation symporter, partial [Duodenibacillus sp.]|nr:dicarboxylate/amino acid:cation symporter [Duodenibacillus sp.]
MASNKMKLGLAWQMFIGMGLGAVVGLLVSSDFATTWLQPLGTLFIRLIRMVVVPLVIATLIAGAANIADVSKLGRVALKILLVYAIGTAIAVVFGLFFAGIIEPGVGLNLATDGLVAKKVTAPPLVQTLLNIVPINPMEAFSKGAMLQIIFFAVTFGFCLAAMGEKGRPVINFFDIVGEVMIRMTNAVMSVAPIGVFGLIAYTVARHGAAVLLPLAKLIMASVVATALYVALIQLPAIRAFGGTKVVSFLKGIVEPWLIAFTTCSSAAALPANIKASRRLGATKAITYFSLPLGNTINMAGTAIYMGVTAIFAAQVFGISLSLADQATIVLMGVFAAIGTAGVPGAGLIMTTIVFTQVGIPLEAVALIAGVDRILDM